MDQLILTEKQLKLRNWLRKIDINRTLYKRGQWWIQSSHIPNKVLPKSISKKHLKTFDILILGPAKFLQMAGLLKKRDHWKTPNENYKMMGWFQWLSSHTRGKIKVQIVRLLMNLVNSINPIFFALLMRIQFLKDEGKQTSYKWMIRKDQIPLAWKGVKQ